MPEDFGGFDETEMDDQFENAGKAEREMAEWLQAHPSSQIIPDGKGGLYALDTRAIKKATLMPNPGPVDMSVNYTSAPSSPHAEPRCDICHRRATHRSKIIALGSESDWTNRCAQCLPSGDFAHLFQVEPLALCPVLCQFCYKSATHRVKNKSIYGASWRPSCEEHLPHAETRHLYYIESLVSLPPANKFYDPLAPGSVFVNCTVAGSANNPALNACRPTPPAEPKRPVAPDLSDAPRRFGGD